MMTIGGGEVLDAAPHKHRRFHQDVLDSLKTKEEGNLDAIISDFLINTKNIVATKDDLAAYVHISKAEVSDTVNRMVTEGILIPMKEGYIHKDTYKSLRGKVVQALLNYHHKYPLRAGMPLEEFRSRFSKQIPDKEISTLIPLLTADQSCRLDGKYIAASSFKIQLTEAQKKQLKQLQKMVDDAGFNPVKIDDGILPGTDISELARLKQGEDFIFLTPEYIIAKKKVTKQH